jgi:hypothetical protein
MATTVASFCARPVAARPVGRKAMAGAPMRATVSNGATTVMAARASWLPGSTPPAHLKGILPGDFGAGLPSTCVGPETCRGTGGELPMHVNTSQRPHTGERPRFPR